MATVAAEKAPRASPRAAGAAKAPGTIGARARWARDPTVAGAAGAAQREEEQEEEAVGAVPMQEQEVDQVLEPLVF